MHQCIAIQDLQYMHNRMQETGYRIIGRLSGFYNQCMYISTRIANHRSKNFTMKLTMNMFMCPAYLMACLCDAMRKNFTMQFIM
jgi:hypothetical protein